jgi:hypothetical protein
VSWRKKKKECLDERGRGGDERGVLQKKPDLGASSPPHGILSLSAFSTAKTEELKEKWNNGALSFSLSNEK